MDWISHLHTWKKRAFFEYLSCWHNFQVSNSVLKVLKQGRGMFNLWLYSRPIDCHSVHGDTKILHKKSVVVTVTMNIWPACLCYSCLELSLNVNQPFGAILVEDMGWLRAMKLMLEEFGRVISNTFCPWILLLSAAKRCHDIIGMKPLFGSPSVLQLAYLNKDKASCSFLLL